MKVVAGVERREERKEERTTEGRGPVYISLFQKFEIALRGLKRVLQASLSPKKLTLNREGAAQVGCQETELGAKEHSARGMSRFIGFSVLPSSLRRPRSAALVVRTLEEGTTQSSLAQLNPRQCSAAAWPGVSSAIRALDL